MIVQILCIILENKLITLRDLEIILPVFIPILLRSRVKAPEDWCMEVMRSLRELNQLPKGDSLNRTISNCQIKDNVDQLRDYYNHNRGIFIKKSIIFRRFI